MNPKFPKRILAAFALGVVYSAILGTRNVLGFPFLRTLVHCTAEEAAAAAAAANDEASIGGGELQGDDWSGSAHCNSTRLVAQQATLWRGAATAVDLAGQCVLMPVYGSISDAVGRRPVALWSLMALAFASLCFWAAAAAQSFGAYFVGYVSQGLGGGLQVMVNTMIGDVIRDAAVRTSAYGGYQLSGVVAGFIATATTTALVISQNPVDYSGPTGFLLLVSLVLLVCGVVVWPESLVSRKHLERALTRPAHSQRTVAVKLAQRDAGARDEEAGSAESDSGHGATQWHAHRAHDDSATHALIDPVVTSVHARSTGKSLLARHGVWAWAHRDGSRSVDSDTNTPSSSAVQPGDIELTAVPQVGSESSPKEAAVVGADAIAADSDGSTLLRRTASASLVMGGVEELSFALPTPLAASPPAPLGQHRVAQPQHQLWPVSARWHRGVCNPCTGWRAAFGVSRTMRLLLGATCLAMFSLSVLVTAQGVVTLLYHWSNTASTLGTLGATAVAGIGIAASGPLTKCMGPAKLLVSGFLALAVGMAVMSLAPLHPGLLILGVLIAAGACVCLPAFLSLGAGLAPPDKQGVVQTSITSVALACFAAGAVVFAGLFYQMPTAGALQPGFVLSAIGLLGAAGLVRRVTGIVYTAGRH